MSYDINFSIGTLLVLRQTLLYTAKDEYGIVIKV
jgi:hypothetical protein